MAMIGNESIRELAVLAVPECISVNAPGEPQSPWKNRSSHSWWMKGYTEVIHLDVNWLIENYGIRFRDQIHSRATGTRCRLLGHVARVSR
jgi:hypothetical protein